MQAFNNDQKLKADLLEEARKHEAADKIVQGTYGNYRGWCAVGCTIKSYNDRRGKTFEISDHSVYEKELGIPRMIARLEDRIFEGMDLADAKGFPVKFLDAITPGADLSLVTARFFVWLLIDKVDGVIKFGSPASRKAIKRVADLYQSKIDGNNITSIEWKQAAAYAAAYAATATAAYAATTAATAAYAATATAAYATAAAAAAATAAAAAAYAATAAYAAAYADATTTTAYAYAAAYADATTTTRKTHFKKMADKLLELLREAK